MGQPLNALSGNHETIRREEVVAVPPVEGIVGADRIIPFLNQVARMTSLPVPPLSSMSTRHTCFWGEPRFAAMASRR